MRRRPLLLPILALLASACSDVPSPASVEGDPEVLSQRPGGAGGGGAACRLGVEPEEALRAAEEMAALVAELGSRGSLTRGDLRSTEVLLRNALRSLSAGRTCPARAQLDAFRRRIEELLRRGVLSGAEASPFLQRLRILEGAEPLPGDPAEMYAPGAFGEVRSVVVNGEEFVYEVIDGLAIAQGDIILGYVDEFEARARAADVSGGGGGGRPGRSSPCRFSHFSCERWNDQTIGYDFADDWGSPAENAMMRSRILNAIAHWSENTGLRFVRRTGGERAVFRNSTGCSSHVGRRVVTGLEPQWINVGTECGVGTIIHEIAHAVGIWHEQSRNDRDDFVRIFPGRIEPGREHNFRTTGSSGFEVGPYDFASVMHYTCGAFRADGVTGNTLEPLPETGVTCADVRGDVLTPVDVLGAFTLYPPEFAITGATDGAVSDLFLLEATFSTKPIKDDYVFWTSDRLALPWATGKVASTGDAALPEGDHLITARIIVAGTEILRRSVRIRIERNAPAVELGPDLVGDLNRLVTVGATVSDPEDGPCDPTVCRYSWVPEPESGQGGPVARYRFGSEGPREVRLFVRDRSGAVGEDAVTVDVVNSPPVPVLVSPAAGTVIPAGAELRLRGFQRDVNEGPDPGPGLTTCRLTWTSSDPSDEVVWRRNDISDGCSGAIDFGDPGPRTIRLTARDPQGLEASTAVEVTVVACATDCDPLPTFTVLTPPDFDGAAYDPPVPGSGWYLGSQITLVAEVFDPDATPDGFMDFVFKIRPPCFSPGSCPSEIVLDSGRDDSLRRVGGPGASARFDLVGGRWTPGETVAAWDNCVTAPLPFTLILEATDPTGRSATVTRQIWLACALV